MTLIRIAGQNTAEGETTPARRHTRIVRAAGR